jgi:hypothetical protein
MVAQPYFETVPITDRHARVKFKLHRGQSQAWRARERILAVIAGTQSGKTSFGPLWLMREIKECGPGDYLIAAPTFPLLSLKLIPEFRRLFVDQFQWGELRETPQPKFTMSDEKARLIFGDRYDPQVPTVVHFGYAANPDSLESMTAKAAWLDEAGQRQFKVGSWEAILRRLSLAMGRILITTTPYSINSWLKKQVFDKAHDPRESIRVISFRSIDNPVFPRDEWNRAKRNLPRWKFDMMYGGKFTRPAGLIYDTFDPIRHTCPRFAIGRNWPRWLGMDFGGVNTVGVYITMDPDKPGIFYGYRVYKGSNLTAAQHVEGILYDEPYIMPAYGGAKSEQQWRDEFKAAGLPILQPLTTEVEIGIDRVASAITNDSLIIFDDLDDWIDERETYSRELDENGEPTEEIADKSSYHVLDAERYVVGSIYGRDLRTSYIASEPTPFGADLDEYDPYDELSA